MIDKLTSKQTGYITTQTTGDVHKNEKSEAKKTSKTDKADFSGYEKSKVKTTGERKLSTAEIEELQKEADKSMENLRSLVEKLILRQKQKAEGASESLTDAKTIEEAKQAISEDGEYGVKAVSERIANFAISACGGDKTKMSEMRAAIEEGFAQAKKAFGGELPEICGQTYDAIMKKLDDWENGTEITE